MLRDHKYSLNNPPNSWSLLLLDVRDNLQIIAKKMFLKLNTDIILHLDSDNLFLLHFHLCLEDKCWHHHIMKIILAFSRVTKPPCGPD